MVKASLDHVASVVKEHPRREREGCFAYMERIAVLAGLMPPGRGQHPADHDWKGGHVEMADVAETLREVS